MSFLRDVRFALRTLAKNPSFTVAAVLALALAIGANTAVFSVVNVLMNFPFPFAEPERVAFLFGENAAQNVQQGPLSADEFLDLRDEMRSFASLTAATGGQFNVTGSGEPQRITADLVTPGFLAVVGTELAHGRAFLAEEGVAGRDRVVIVSHGFWQQALGGGDALGASLELDGETHTVIGVAPPDFFFFNPNTAVWKPLVLERGAEERDLRQYVVLGRLADGVTIEEARAEAATVGDRFATAHPATNEGWTLSAITMPANTRQGSLFASTLLYSAISFVLLIACVNVANLILARALARDRELALRSSLGASRRRLVGQMLIESVTLALLGGGLGFVLGAMGIGLLRDWLAPDPNAGFLSRFIELDAGVALHSAAISLLAGVLFGLFPALQITRGNLASSLREGGRGGESRGRRLLRDVLVSAEVALALALLITTGVLIRAFDRLYHIDPGLETANLLSLDLALPERDYPEPEPTKRFFAELEERLEALPGVRDAAVTSQLPLSGFAGAGSARAIVEGRDEADAEDDRSPNVNEIVVSHDYLATMDIELLAGRHFDRRDRADSEPVIIVTRQFADRILEGETVAAAIDRRVRFDSPGDEEPGPFRRIIGVVADHQAYGRSLRLAAPPPVAFFPVEQESRPAMTVVARTAADPLALSDAARAVVWELDPRLPIDQLRSLEQAEAAHDTQNRFFLRILSGLALAALILAAVGIYGIIAYSVNQRRREIGIRVALGARPAQTVGLVARQAARLTAVGLVFGCGLAWLLVRFTSSQLESIAESRAGGPLTFAVVIGVFMLTALLASVVPAGRAVRVDPAGVLREE